MGEGAKGGSGSPYENAPATAGERVPRDSGGRPASAPLSAALERLGAHTPGQDRYELQGEVARGGMGVIQRVWDGDLGRAVARKLLGRDGQGSDSRKSDPRTVGRFLEEAQITAQLEHPGIVPVHELGLDAKGTLYFTMRLVRGEDLHKVFEHVRTGGEGWSVTRALGVVLKACEALSFAHQKGVIHRDLKPGNVMVGRFGEVYVMDWGLARVLGEPDTKDVRPRPEPESVVVRTASRREGDTPESPLLTRDGDVIGTPAYMSPEQARGDLARLDARTDVYALGAMLYHLLSGRVPYSEPGRRLEAHAVLQRVLAGPPAPLAQLAPSTPPELLAIAERALARAPEERYASVSDLADDLRAYLELRVVRAYRTGPLVELGKWVRRNRLSAASLAGLLLVGLSSGLVIARQQSTRLEQETRRRLELLAANLVREADSLWPIDPRRVTALDRWLEQAIEVLAVLPAVRAELAAFRAAHADAAQSKLPERPDFEVASLESRLETYRQSMAMLDRRERPATLSEEQFRNALTFSDANRAVLEIEIPAIEREIASRREARTRESDCVYSDPGLQEQWTRLTGFARDLESLSLPDGGLHSVVSRRRELAASLGDRTLVAEERAWKEARASCANRDECPLYDGLDLVPQMGLVPLGLDTRSGLWEFWHALSGERPLKDADGNWQVRPETGIVLVLVPSGMPMLGSQDEDPSGPNFFAPEPGVDEGLRQVDRWIADVPIAPFFLAKHELTQGQWLRLSGQNPSEHRAGNSFLGFPRLDRTHPVESVSWIEASDVLARHGLELPTEAQWEHAARAGTQTKYSTGATIETLLPYANFGDATAERHGIAQAILPYEDGFALHAPVDALPADAWGFHGLFGNVEEWCRDWYASSCERGRFLVDGTGEHVPRSGRLKAYRGGGFRSAPDQLWVSSRHGRLPHSFELDLGIRPSRSLSPK